MKMQWKTTHPLLQLGVLGCDGLCVIVFGDLSLHCSAELLCLARLALRITQLATHTCTGAIQSHMSGYASKHKTTIQAHYEWMDAEATSM